MALFKINDGVVIDFTNDGWAEFKKWLDGTYARLRYTWVDEGLAYAIVAFDDRIYRTFSINKADATEFEATYKNAIYNTDGNPMQTPYEWAATLGLLPGVVVGRASGYVGTSGTGGVAVRATAYSPQGTNAQRSLKSSSANDTAAGTGARTVRVTYLNTSFELKTEDVTLNGTAAVNTVATDIAFLEKMEVLTAGTQGGGNAGTISIYTATAGSGSVWGSIATGDNMTYWAHHYVPTGKTCRLLCMSGSATVVGGSTTFNRSGNPLGTTQPQKGLGTTLVHGVANYNNHEFRIPIALVGPDFVWLVERPLAATASTAYGFFEYIEQ